LNVDVPLTIRYAEASEVETLTAIEIDADQRYVDSAHPEIANGDHIPTEALARAVGARQVIVAVEDDAILGWLLLTKSGDELCIGQISVRRSAGAKGVGTKLLDTIIESVRSAGHRSVVLNTQADVPWNQPWYERRGFVVVPPQEWTADMHVIADEQRADGLDWSTRVHMRLHLGDASDS
jgi:GNAT superfamily N-acetyltransferase